MAGKAQRRAWQPQCRDQLPPNRHRHRPEVTHLTFFALVSSLLLRHKDGKLPSEDERLICTKMFMTGSLVASVTKARLLLRTQDSSLHFHWGPGGGGNQLAEWECPLLFVGNTNLIKKKGFQPPGWSWVEVHKCFSNAPMLPVCTLVLAAVDFKWTYLSWSEETGWQWAD